MDNRKYEPMMDGSQCVTYRNRRHLRRIPGPDIHLEEDNKKEGEVEQESEQQTPSVPEAPVQNPV